MEDGPADPPPAHPGSCRPTAPPNDPHSKYRCARDRRRGPSTVDQGFLAAAHEPRQSVCYRNQNQQHPAPPGVPPATACRTSSAAHCSPKSPGSTGGRNRVSLNVCPAGQQGGRMLVEQIRQSSQRPRGAAELISYKVSGNPSVQGAFPAVRCAERRLCAAVRDAWASATVRRSSARVGGNWLRISRVMRSRLAVAPSIWRRVAPPGRRRYRRTRRRPKRPGVLLCAARSGAVEASRGSTSPSAPHR